MTRTPALVLVALLLAAGCGTEPDSTADSTAEGVTAPTTAAGYPLELDDCGRTVVLEEPPQRILTMGSTASTLMWAAGGTDAITTRASEGEADLGPAAQALADVPLISNDDDLPLEAILGEEPDLVITYGLNLTTREDLSAAGVESVVNRGFCDGGGSGPADGPVTFEDDVFPDVLDYGRIAGTSGQAQAAVEDLRRRIGAAAQTPLDPAVQTAAAITLDGNALSAYGLASLTHDQLTTLGLTDVFADLPKRLNDVSLEELIGRDPDALVLLTGGLGVGKDALAALRALPGADRITAVREGRVVPLQAPYLLGGPLAVDGLEAMARALRAP